MYRNSLITRVCSPTPRVLPWKELSPSNSLIYDEKEGGALLWQERQNVIVSNGIFHVLLGTVTLIPYSVFNGDDRYFTIQIGDEAELQPRQRLVSVAYAFRSHAGG
jgi:hypothetical protein